MKRVLFLGSILLTVFINYGTSRSQSLSDKESNVSFAGFIHSAHDGSPLEYASIFVEERTTGTISNSAGEFKLIIPVSMLPATVTISSLGFETLTVRVTDSLTGLRYFSLKPGIRILDTVTITSRKNDSSGYILERALKAIRFNYPRKDHLLEGFYRSTSILDTSYMRIIEAAIRIQQGNYMHDPYSPGALTMNQPRINIVELRKTDDFRDKDWRVKVGEKMFGESNELYEILGKNWISSLNSNTKENYIMTKKFILMMETELLGTVLWENEMAYKIAATRHVENLPFWTDVFLYINKKDFAIVRIEYLSRANPNPEKLHVNLSEWLIEGKYFDRTEANYRRINYKYYPVFIRKVSGDRDASQQVEVNGTKMRQYTDNIFLLTNVYEDDFEKVKWKDAEARDQNLSHYDRPYNEAFWRNYNTILLNPLGKSYEELKRKLVKAR